MPFLRFACNLLQFKQNYQRPTEIHSPHSVSAEFTHVLLDQNRLALFYRYYHIRVISVRCPTQSCGYLLLPQHNPWASVACIKMCNGSWKSLRRAQHGIQKLIIVSSKAADVCKLKENCGKFKRRTPLLTIKAIYLHLMLLGAGGLVMKLLPGKVRVC